jgi:FAD:protein FMN transferase
MGTLVTIEVLRADCEEAVERAFGWFFEIEERCTRFKESSELMQLTAQAGAAVEVSPILYEAVRFALSVAEESGGAFDPTVGHRMEARGFNREHRTGEIVRSAVEDDVIRGDEEVSYQDIQLDPEHSTITLRRRLTLDLGSVAKGLAVDTAARELAPFRDFAIDAGGDLYLGGFDSRGEPWSVGIRHPRRDRELIDSVRVSNKAVCTSGDYERGPHILDPRPGHPETAAVASATVIAEGAMLADALATAAYVMGPKDGIQFLTRMGVEGLIVTADLERYETRGLRRAA